MTQMFCLSLVHVRWVKFEDPKKMGTLSHDFRENFRDPSMDHQYTD